MGPVCIVEFIYRNSRMQDWKMANGEVTEIRGQRLFRPRCMRMIDYFQMSRRTINY
jgi:hypothetical protein